MMTRTLALAIFSIANFCVDSCVDFGLAAEPFWRETPTGSNASLRAVGVAQHSTDKERQAVWACGARGTVVRSIDAGVTWKDCGPKDYPTLEFRALHAWNENRLVIASAGTPAVILRTDNGGDEWTEVFRSENAKSFLNGLRFVDKQRGIAFGDPIDGRLQILRTIDSGEHWQPIELTRLPEVLQDEAAFAASNSALAFDTQGTVWIATGGTEATSSRLHSSRDFGDTWQVVPCPIASGKSMGPFSVSSAPSEQGVLVVVGGDFRLEAISKTKAAFSRDNGKSFQLSSQQPRAFRSAVCFTPGKGLIKTGFYATGPIGTDYSSDGDLWIGKNDIGFHAIAVLPSGGLVAVGAGGRCGWAE